MKTILLLLACLTYWTSTTVDAQTPAPPNPPAANPATQSGLPQSASWFAEAGASTGNTLTGGLGIAIQVPANQQIFGEIALQTGAGVAQSSQLLIGVKSNYPGITRSGRKFTPFSIVAYGASIQSLATTKITAPTSVGLDAATVTSIGTSAGFAQQYAAGVETIVGIWNVGVGFSGDKITSGWKGYPFVFLSREFGK